MVDPHIHMPNDGRGPRNVYVNGKLMKRVVYADTRRGIVRYVDEPARIHKRRETVIERTRRGKVEVKPIEAEASEMAAIVPLRRDAYGRLGTVRP